MKKRWKSTAITAVVAGSMGLSRPIRRPRRVADSGRDTACISVSSPVVSGPRVDDGGDDSVRFDDVR
jgi:hypothetical protein